MKNDILTRYYQVLLYDYMEEYEESIKFLSEYISNIKNNPFAYNNRGITYSEVGMLEEAVSDFEESVKIKMNHIPYKNLGMILEGNGFLDKALEAYNNALNFYDKDATILRCRAHLYIKLGKTEDAINDFTRAIKIEPDFAYTYFERSEQYKLQKKNELALKDLEKYNNLKK
jgi:tetratricopeptide (TPR) repeat protein